MFPIRRTVMCFCSLFRTRHLQANLNNLGITIPFTGKIAIAFISSFKRGHSRCRVVIECWNPLMVYVWYKRNMSTQCKNLCFNMIVNSWLQGSTRDWVYRLLCTVPCIGGFSQRARILYYCLRTSKQQTRLNVMKTFPDNIILMLLRHQIAGNKIHGQMTPQ